jgi:hypothetical protein
MWMGVVPLIFSRWAAGREELSVGALPAGGLSVPRKVSRRHRVCGALHRKEHTVGCHGIPPFPT